MEKLKPKLFSVMKIYTKQQFVKDVVAGIIVAIIALPLSIALALASGVGPEQGIYTAIIAGFFDFLFYLFINRHFTAIAYNKIHFLTS